MLLPYFFADDLMLFSSAIASCALAMKNVLDKFCFSLGQKVSFIMFRVVSLPKWILPIREEICKILDIKETMDIRSYFDFPISAKAIRQIL